MRVRFPHVTITTNSELYFPLTMFKLYLKILWKIVLTIVQN